MWLAEDSEALNRRSDWNNTNEDSSLKNNENSLYPNVRQYVRVNSLIVN